MDSLTINSAVLEIMEVQISLKVSLNLVNCYMQLFINNVFSLGKFVKSASQGLRIYIKS